MAVVAHSEGGLIGKLAMTGPEIRVCRHFNDANLVGALYHHLDPAH